MPHISAHGNQSFLSTPTLWSAGWFFLPSPGYSTLLSLRLALYCHSGGEMATVWFANVPSHSSGTQGAAPSLPQTFQLPFRKQALFVWAPQLGRDPEAYKSLSKQPGPKHTKYT